MWKTGRAVMSILCITLLYLLPCDAEAGDFTCRASLKPAARTLEVIRNRYGNDVARLYETIAGMPVFDPDSKYKFDVHYTRDDHPCNDIFLKENPDMAEYCGKARESVTFINRHGKKVRVDIRGDELVSIDLRTPLDKERPRSNRDVILLNNALIVHDCLLKCYSHNQAKIFHFPSVIPSLEFDKEQNVLFRFGDQDFIKFQADDFTKSECRGFKLSSKPQFNRNRTRVIPDIHYTGNQVYLVTTNWTYPPLDGQFSLYHGEMLIGTLPANFLYKRLKNDRAHPRFKEEGLLTYLRKRDKTGLFRGPETDTVHGLTKISN
ncbi:MAG: hypothetical protein ACOWYE_03480 [Desulfatiglandales bacterium]